MFRLLNMLEMRDMEPMRDIEEWIRRNRCVSRTFLDRAVNESILANIQRSLKRLSSTVQSLRTAEHDYILVPIDCEIVGVCVLP